MVPIFTGFHRLEPKNSKSTKCLQVYDAGCKAVTRPLAQFGLVLSVVIVSK